jgi:hypothetical protein
MAKDGEVLIVVSPGSISATTLCRPSARSRSIVVHRWPFRPTYWRSSSQIGHRSGGSSSRSDREANWTPQVSQMNAGMIILDLNTTQAPYRLGS